MHYRKPTSAGVLSPEIPLHSNTKAFLSLAHKNPVSYLPTPKAVRRTFSSHLPRSPSCQEKPHPQLSRYLCPNYKQEPAIKSTSPDLVPIKSLGLDVSVECNSILHVRITDKANDRWEPIETISDDYKAKIQTCENTKSLKDLGFSFTEDKTSPFTFSMTADNEVYFNSAETNFLFTDKFIAFGGYLTSDDVYGFGERYHKLKLGEGIFTLWPNDTCGIHEDKGDGGYNAMGTHPMALHKTSSGKFLGLLFNNINAQDVMIKKYEEKKVLLEHRTIGGIIDYYFYLGSSVDDTLIKLHDVIGQPMLPPFWSLGFHQCRWGYHNTSEIETVMKKFLDYEIPDKIILLGDLYYHGPRNDLTQEYAPMKVAEILNSLKDKLLVVKGNCDKSEIDGIFNFGLTYIRNITINNVKITLTHGHIYNRNNLPEECGQIFLYGHTHVGSIERIGDRIIANPGSISKPRGGSCKSYITIDEENITLKKLDGEVIRKLNINNTYHIN